jgi:hypothetical protein
MQNNDNIKLTSKSSESEVNTRVQESLESHPSLTSDDIQNCILSCIDASKQVGLLNYSPKEQMIEAINSIIFYLSHSLTDTTQIPSKQLLSSVDVFMHDLMEIVDTTCGQYGDKLPHTSNKYKTIRKSFEQALSTIESKIISENTSDVPSKVSSDENTTEHKIKSGRVRKSNIEKKDDTATLENIPDDLEWINGTPDLYISPSQGKAYIKRGGIKTYFKLVFDILPSKVVKLHVPGAYKGQATQYRMTLGGQTEVFSRDDLRYGKWPELYKNCVGVANIPANGQYAQIIDYLATKEIVENNFLQTGIHEVDGTYGYLLPNGQFLTGDKECSIPVNFAHKYRGDLLDLWDNWSEKTSIWDENAAIEAVKYCIGLSPIKGLGVVSLSHHTRTLSRSVKSSDFRTGHLLYARGQAGSGKTSLNCLTANVAKPSLYDGSLETNYKGTKTSIEKIIDAYGDIPFLIDDFEPGDSQAEKKAGEALLTALAKSAYDGTAIRPRQNGDMSDKKSNFVHTFPTTTSTFYPSDLSEGALRRTFFMEISKGDLKADDSAFNLTYAHKFHKEGLSKLGRQIVLMHISKLNEKGRIAYSEERLTFFAEYKQNIKKLVTALWTEQAYGDLPSIVDNLLTISANITVGAKDIDDVTHNACQVVDLIQKPLARMVFEQLLLMEGMRHIDGESLLNDAIAKLFDSIVEGKAISNTIYQIMDYRSKDGNPPDIKVHYNGKVYTIPMEQWEGPDNSRYGTPLIAAYVDFNEKEPNKSILYLTSAGRDALLFIAKNIEGLEHVKTSTKLSQIIDKEGWIIKRNNKNLTVPCNPKVTNVQVTCIALSFEKVLNLIFDVQSFVDACEEGDKKESSPKGKGPSTSASRKSEDISREAEDRVQSLFESFNTKIGTDQVTISNEQTSKAAKKKGS